MNPTSEDTRKDLRRWIAALDVNNGDGWYDVHPLVRDTVERISKETTVPSMTRG